MPVPVIGTSLHNGQWRPKGEDGVGACAIATLMQEPSSYARFSTPSPPTSPCQRPGEPLISASIRSTIILSTNRPAVCDLLIPELFLPVAAVKAGGLGGRNAA